MPGDSPAQGVGPFWAQRLVLLMISTPRGPTGAVLSQVRGVDLVWAVPEVGFEPTRPLGRLFLGELCLPFQHSGYATTLRLRPIFRPRYVGVSA